MKTTKYIIVVALPGVLALLVWQLAASMSDRTSFLFGSPVKVGGAIINGMFGGRLLEHTGVTAAETILGLILGCGCGTVLGLLLSCSEATARVSRPYVIALGSIPVFAIAPMTIIWFGTGFWAKVIIAGLSTLFVATVQAYEGARNVDADLLELMRSLGSTRWRTFRKIVAPSALVWVLASYRINVGFALLGAFVGEFIASTRGLGHYILQGSSLYDVPQVLAGITMMIIIALALTQAVAIGERVLMPWRSRAASWSSP